ncbi:MAG TPA: hypothetical protein VNW90_07420, partial [Acetobacteraceae bacterium]|nr:hypothetical protein [Acetobacteraceae bacterium]
GVSTATPAGTLYKIGLRNEMVQDMHPLTRSPAAAWWGRPIRCDAGASGPQPWASIRPPTK